MLSFIVKTQNTPNLKSVLDALSIAPTERDAALERIAESIGAVRNEIRETKESAQQCVTHTERSVEVGEQTKAVAQESKEIGRTATDIAREIRNQGTQDSSNQLLSYAAVAARGTVASSVHNTQSLKTSTAQILRKVIVNIRDPVTIQSLRAMNPRNLKAHVERAIKTVTNSDMVALRQFADDWSVGGRLPRQQTQNGRTESLPSPPACLVSTIAVCYDVLPRRTQHTRALFSTFPSLMLTTSSRQATCSQIEAPMQRTSSIMPCGASRKMGCATTPFLACPWTKAPKLLQNIEPGRLAGLHSSKCSRRKRWSVLIRATT